MCAARADVAAAATATGTGPKRAGRPARQARPMRERLQAPSTPRACTHTQTYTHTHTHTHTHTRCADARCGLSSIRLGRAPLGTVDARTERGEDPELVRRLRQVVLIDLGPVHSGPARHLQRQAGAHAHDFPVSGEGELPEVVGIKQMARVLRDVGALARR